MNDPGPMVRFEEVLADVAAPEEVFRLLTDPDEPMTLEAIARTWRVPRGRFVEWFTTEHAERFEAASRVLGVTLVQAVKKMVDDATAQNAGLVKLRTDRYLRLAALVNPERYSPKVEHKHSGVAPMLNIVLLDRPSDGGRVIEGTPVPSALAAPVVVEEAGVI